MAKKPSTGAARRSAARTKSERIAKPKATPLSAPPRRAARTAKAPALKVKDPALAENPIPFEGEAYKFVLTPSAPPRFEIPAYEYLGELPDSYGTRRLYLVARDPQFLFAYWDFYEAQLADLSQRAGDGNVYLQLYLETGEKLQQIQVHGGTKNWYLQANRPGAAFYAELGFYHADGRFEPAARSGTVSTPRDHPSSRTDAKFVTLPFELSFRELKGIIQNQLAEGEELVEGLARLQAEGVTLPFDALKPRGKLQGNAVYDYLGEEVVRRLRVGSLDIVETLRRRFEEAGGTSSGQWASSPFSPFGASFGQPRGFFLHVNAELILYGGTDPKAKVRINGQDLKLQEDGTFSFHFNFPDGQFHIPIEAASPDGKETRAALLSFLRLSDSTGEVTATPQAPRPEPIGRIV